MLCVSDRHRVHSCAGFLVTASGIVRQPILPPLSVDGLAVNTAVFSLERMHVLKNRLLPLVVVRERSRAGLSQKQLALDAGVFQTVVCAIEKGRRRAIGRDLVGRLSAALKLDEARAQDLGAAAEHDRIVAEVEKGCLASSAPLVSAALLAGHYLESAEQAGLKLKIQRSVDSKTYLRSLRNEAAAAGEGEPP